MKLLTLTTAIAFLLALASQAGASSWKLGKYDPGYHNVVNAIYFTWCGHRYVYCGEGYEAYRVAGCESTYNVYAQNGQYLGLFQMGSYARARFGHGYSPWVQARAAHRYYSTAGWAPWSCQP